MARPKKSVTLNADDQTIVEYFDQAMAAKAAQGEASKEITALNSTMQEAGVDPGTLSLCCRLAKMKPGKRGISVALLHRYLQVLASRLADPTVEPAEPVAEASTAVPFEQRRRTA